MKLLDHIVELAPDFTEAWNRRAYVHFVRNEIELALGDLRRALALDPNHFKALDGLGQILREIGQKKAALKAFKQLLEVHPYWSGAQQARRRASPRGGRPGYLSRPSGAWFSAPQARLAYRPGPAKTRSWRALPPPAGVLPLHRRFAAGAGARMC